MRLDEPGGEQPIEMPALDFFAGKPEDSFGALIKQDDPLILAHGDNRVVSGVDNGA
jgi:hypothetical protein